jgi:integrase/recombinase XerD
MELYCRLQVVGGSAHIERAKRSDLQKFLWFYTRQFGNDQVRYWTPSMTRAFQKQLQTGARGQGEIKEINAGVKKKNGEWQRTHKPLSATSVNRIMATLHHFAKWLHAQ